MELVVNSDILWNVIVVIATEQWY